jgi:ketosteroid isomerase-like protein
MGAARDLVDRAWRAFEAHDYAALPDIFAAELDFVYPGGVILRSPAEVEQFLRVYAEALPDMRIEPVAHIESGDDIATEQRIHGTHTGTLRTPNGDIAATGREVVIESVDFIRTRGGQIISWHVYYDSMAVLQQLGLAPS